MSESTTICVPTGLFDALVSVLPSRKRASVEDAAALWLEFISLRSYKPENLMCRRVRLPADALLSLVGRELLHRIQQVWLEQCSTRIFGGSPGRGFRIAEFHTDVEHLHLQELQTIPALRRHERFWSPCLIQRCFEDPQMSVIRQYMTASGSALLQIFYKQEHRNKAAWRCFRAFRFRHEVFRARMFSRDSLQARMYTSVTGFPKEYRPALRLDGQPLVEADISHCALWCLLSVMGSSASSGFDEAVRSGALYALLAAATGMDRMLAKRLFFSACNTKDKSQNWLLPIWGAFKSMFPGEAEFLESNCGEQGIYHLYATEEAGRMLPAVYSLLRKGIPAISLHDACLTTEKHTDEVLTAMKSAFPGATVRMRSYSS